MACSACGDAGHNRRTHRDHQEPQAESLLAEVIAEVAGCICPSTCPIHDRLTVGGLVPIEEDPTYLVDQREWSGPDEAEAAGLAAAIAQTMYERDDSIWDEDGTLRLVEDQDGAPLPAEQQPCWAGYQGPQIAPWRTHLGPAEPIRITEPGVYELTAEEYHDTAITGAWFSNSDGKKLLATCPAQFQHDREHNVRKTSDAFDFGHVWHAVILGKGEAYEVFEPKKLDGRTVAGKAQKAEVDAARAAGITPIYGDQFAIIRAMADAVQANPKAHELLTAPGRSEVCLFWREQIKVTDPRNKLFGQIVTVQRRAMIDHLPDMPEGGGPVTLVDGKSADEVKPDDNMRKKIYDYAYHRQAKTYQDAIEHLFGRYADVVFVFQSKNPPHLIVPVDLDTPAMMIARRQNHEALEIWAECVATGVWPGYTNGVATSGVPAWIERQYEEDVY
jgi:hypothetical protein